MIGNSAADCPERLQGRWVSGTSQDMPQIGT